MEEIDNSIKFYSFHACERTPEKSDCVEFKRNNSDIDYPCLILMRFNNWNDYGFYTKFSTYYLRNKDEEIIFLGYIKIIHTQAENGYTTLPDNFKSLSKNKFFSRGTVLFYNRLNSLGEFKNIILSALNDIHYKGYTKEHISEIEGGCLLGAYENSLFRDDSYEFDSLEVSSEYAKNSLDMLSKIEACENLCSPLEETNRKVIMKLLYGSVITTLESYLGDAFKYQVINNKNYFYSFLINYKFPQGEKKYTLKELGLHGNKIGEFIENKVEEILNNIIFHKLKYVNELYKDILDIDLPSRWVDFLEPVQKRHDIFHRNGKNIAGVDLDIEYIDIYGLILKTKKFIDETECILEVQT